MREDCRTPNPVLRLKPISVMRDRVRVGEGMRQEACIGRVEDIGREERYVHMGGVGIIQGRAVP